jgi:hypothetical protein
MGVPEKNSVLVLLSLIDVKVKLKLEAVMAASVRYLGLYSAPAPKIVIACRPMRQSHPSQLLAVDTIVSWVVAVELSTQVWK